MDTRGVASALVMISGLVVMGCDGAHIRTAPDGGTGAASGDASAAALAVGLDRDNFRERLASVFCAALQPCCVAVGLPYGLEGCLTRMRTALRQPFEGVDSSATVFNRDAGAACLLAIESYAGLCVGDDLWDLYRTLESDPAFAPCRPVLTGTKSVGQACTTTSDCVQEGSKPIDCVGDGLGGGYCKVREPFTPIPPTYDRIGQPCHSELNLEVCIDTCEPGAFCDAGFCAPQRATGNCTDVCRRTCTAETYCLSSLCQPRPDRPAGAPCTQYDQCAGSDSTCHVGGVCGPRLLYACNG